MKQPAKAVRPAIVMASFFLVRIFFMATAYHSMAVQVPLRSTHGSIKLRLAEMSRAKFIPRSDATFVESVRT